MCICISSVCNTNTLTLGLKMANKYIKVEYDKFKELTSSVMASWLNLYDDKKSNYGVILKKVEDAASS